MKKINEIAVPLLAAFTFALYSCQSSDNVSGPVRVNQVTLKAGISGAGSRTTMTDTYGGAFTETWNKDALSIYHPYLKNGVPQGLMPLDFTTTATRVTNAVFSYLGLSDYAYNPGQLLYAFNKLTGGGQSTPSLTGVAASPLSLSLTGWTNQDGTLTGSQNAALYDAMVDIETTDAGGIPTAFSMTHLGGVVCYHLICDGFTVGTAVSGIRFSDGGSTLTCLPSSSIYAINSSGPIKCTSQTFVKNWNPSGSFIPYSYTENGVSGKCVDVYLSTFPQKIIGPLTVSVTIGSNQYVDVITPNYILSYCKVKVISMALKIPNVNYSKFYAWDASTPVVLGVVPTNANTVAGNDGGNHASYVCASCPCANEISWYISQSCYWDSGSITGGNSTCYKMPDGNYTKAGMWFRKKSGITGFSSTLFSGTTSCTPITLTPALASSLNLSTNYFFLPAAGYADSSTGAFSSGGAYGEYWSSSPNSDTTNAYDLYFTSGVAGLSLNSRSYGFSLWQGQ